MLGAEGFIKSCLPYPYTDAYLMLWGRTVKTCLVAGRPDAGICLFRLLLFGIWHAACGP